MVKFVANSLCCPECAALNGMEYPDDTKIFDVSHPNCRCWFEMVDAPGKPVVPVNKMLDAVVAVFDPEEGEDGKPKASKRAARATFKEMTEHLPMLVLDEDELAEYERNKKNMNDTKQTEVRNSESELEAQALKDTLQEEFYTGFQYTNQPEGEIPEGAVETTYDFGSTLVQIAPVGEFVGSDRDGKPVKESVTIDSLQNLLKNIDGEVLVDFDHSSEHTTDTRAAAWATDFMVVENLGNSSGLYGRLKWTLEGREAVMGRKYRFLSPVWQLDDDSHPTRLKSIALTNKPALKGIAPIINSEPSAETKTEPETLNTRNNLMDKEILELVGITPVGEEVSDEEKAQALETIKGWKEYKETAEAQKKAEAEKAEAEAKEKELRNSFDECVKDYDIDDAEDLYEVYKENPELFAKTLNACGRKVKNEEPKPEEPKQEEPEGQPKAEPPVKEQPEAKDAKEPPKEDEPKEDEPKEKEVIPVESLNSKPVEEPRTTYDKAMDMHGQAFLDFVRAHQGEF